jgi:hypothetical protein
MRGLVLQFFTDTSHAGCMVAVISMNTDETTDGCSRKCSLQSGVAQ